MSSFRRLKALIAAGFLGFACFATPAQAETGLVWKWDGERRYFIRAKVQLPTSLLLRKENNVDVRISEFTMSLNTLCKPNRNAGKSAWELHCSFDDVAIVAAPHRSGVGKLKEILDEVDQRYIDSYAQIVFSADGRVKNLSIEGVDDRHRRLRELEETMRLMMARAFAGLDLQLPKKGDDKGRGNWSQNTPLAVQFASPYGSIGSLSVTHAISQTLDGGKIIIESEGSGTVGPGKEQGSERTGETRIKDLYEMNYQGIATFDKSNGLLLERKYLVDGVPTASSDASEYGSIPYVQEVMMLYVEPGKPVPPLGENSELEPGGSRLYQ